jgi:hypothetical protein
MQYHILVFLWLIQKLEAKDANLYNWFKIFSYTNEKFDEKINNWEILEVFKNQLLTVRDPKKVFDWFKEIIKTEVNEVWSGLEDIYPIPKTIFLKIVKEDSHSLIWKYSVADFLDEFKTKCKKDKVSLKGFDTKLLLKIWISMWDDDFKIFFLNLIWMRKSAYNSDLYDII